MFDLKTLKKAIEQISEEKGLDPNQVLEAIESSIAAAYKKEYAKRGDVIKCKFDLKTGEVKFWQIKTVVDETTVRMAEEGEEIVEAPRHEPAPVEGEEERLPRYNEDRHLMLEEAKKVKADVQLGEELEFPLEAQEDFGRIAAQAAK